MKGNRKWPIVALAIVGVLTQLGVLPPVVHDALPHLGALVGLVPE